MQSDPREEVIAPRAETADQPHIVVLRGAARLPSGTGRPWGSEDDVDQLFMAVETIASLASQIGGAIEGGDEAGRPPGENARGAGPPRRCNRPGVAGRRGALLRREPRCQGGFPPPAATLPV